MDAVRLAQESVAPYLGGAAWSDPVSRGSLMPNAWFRMYTDFLEDPKLLGLAFEDQRHFIGVLALKSAGTLDQAAAPKLMDKVVAQRLWIDHSAILEVKRRLIEAELIDEDWQPLAWDKRQFISDHDPSAAERMRKYRERKRQEAKKKELRVTSRVTSRTCNAARTEQNRTETEQKEAPKPAARFRPPSLEEVRKYCTERNSAVNPESFVNWYQSIGWKVSGKTPMKDWKAAVRTWEQREGKTNGSGAKLPVGNSLDTQIELGRLCKTAGISADRVAGKSCDQIRSLLQAEGVGA